MGSLYFFFNIHFSIVGAIHAGLGYSKNRNFLSELNLPIMSKKCYQRHEKNVGNIFREVAEDSCKRAQQLEKELSSEKVC